MERNGQGTKLGLPPQPTRTVRIAAPTNPPESGADVAPGEMIGGHYRLLRALAEGGMGFIYVAQDVDLDREVAIKFLRRELSGDREIRRRLREEARAMARVRHENLVTVYGRGEHKGLPYVVMDYIAGTNLESLLEKTDSLTIDEVLRFLRPVCKGIDAIHAAGVIHRDLKPSNILIGSGFHIAITDLGIAQFFDDPVENVIAGTPAYLAPEVIRLQSVSHSADIYALGALTFELLTKRTPFLAPDAMEMMLKQVHEAPPPPSRFRHGLSPEIDSIILRALAKDPDQRPASANEFIEALAAAVQSKDFGQSPKSALVIDDDPDLCDLVRAILLDSFPGIVVETETSPATALRRLENYLPSLVVTDLRMPNVDGFEITRAVRSLGGSTSVPIIVMTAVGGAEDWKRLASIGANAFLVKPFRPDDLSATVRRLFQLAPAAAAPDRSSKKSPIPVLWIAITLIALAIVTWSISIFSSWPDAIRQQPPSTSSTSVAGPDNYVDIHTTTTATEGLPTKAGSGSDEDNTDTSSDDNTSSTTDTQLESQTSSATAGSSGGDSTVTGAAVGDNETGSRNVKKSTKKSRKQVKSVQPELSPRCQRIQKSASRAASHLDWNGVLLQVAKSECWSDSITKTKLKVRALKELNRFDECVAAGRNSRDSRIQSWVSLCRKRREVRE